MSFQRSFVMGLVVFATLALPGAMTRALARSDGARAPKLTPADEAQMRELLSKLSAASGQVAPEERTEADLMYEAMIRWNGEPAGSAAIERLLEQSKKESTKTKKATVDKVRRMFWKDPFSDSPGKMIPVRQEDRELLASFDRKGQRRGGEARQGRETRDSELARLRAEIDAARAEAAAVRAENARLRERAEELMSSERRECVADNDGRAEVRMRRRVSGSGRSHRHEVRSQLALAPDQAEERQAAVAPPPPPAAEPVMTNSVGSPNPTMVITPLPVNTPSSPSPSPSIEGRRARSSRPAH
jgi:hypothetical protein